MRKEKQLLTPSVPAFFSSLSAHLIKLEEWLIWPHMLGIANKWAQQLAIRTEVLLWSDALPDSYDYLCTSSPDTLLAEPADGGCVWVWGMDRTAVGFRYGTAKLTLSFFFEQSLQNVSFTVFNQARELFVCLFVFFIDSLLAMPAACL